MKIIFKKISIENFKGVKRLHTVFRDKTMVYGANETGKTTFADAVSYVLTGKNSLGESTFQILPKDAGIGASPKVELDIEIIGDDTKREVTLTRAYTAKKNREKEFTGEYQTVCFINGIKTGPKEFDRWISDNICYYELFRLCHDVRYFTENITTNGKEKKWEAQRRLLFAMARIPNDLKMMESNEQFADLRTSLSRYTNIREYFSYLKIQEKKISELISEAKMRIQALEESKETGIDFDKLKKQRAELSIQLDAIRKSMEEKNQRVKMEQQIHLESEICFLEKELQNHLEKHKAAQDEYIDGMKKDCDKKTKLVERQFILNALITDAQKEIDKLNNELLNMNGICPSCGRDLPKEAIDLRKKELLARLEEETNSIKKLKHEMKGITKKIKKIQETVRERPEISNEMRELYNKIQDLKNKLDFLNHSLTESFNEETKELETKIKHLDSAIAEEDRNAKISDKISAIRKEIESKLDERAEVYRLSDLCKDFMEFKCKFSEERINAMFDGVKFKLFRFNKTNEEYRDCCDIFWNGVHYDSLSYSTKFVVGMKIATMFQESKNISIPVIVDNAESIDFGEDYEVQSIFLIKREECCPSCGGVSGRKESDGIWTCKKCGARFEKSIEIISE